MGKRVRDMRCGSCQLLRINGVVCHEGGCPEAWRGEVRECAECGQEFLPESRYHRCCDDSCLRAYLGLPSDVGGEG